MIEYPKVLYSPTGWKTARTPEEAAALQAQGYQARPLVLSGRERLEADRQWHLAEAKRLGAELGIEPAHAPPAPPVKAKR